MSETPDDKMPDEPMDPNHLMPLADGAADPDQRAVAMAALAKDPALMDEYESYEFTRAGGRMARVYDEVLSVPESLLEAVRGAAPAPARSMSSSVSRPALFERIGDFFRLPVFSPALAIPAIAVAAAGGWFASTALHYVPMEQRGYAASAPLQKALEATPSGSTAAVIEGLSLKPTLTFAGLEKTWCRQVELTQGRPSLRSEGLACRMADGSWRVIAFTEPEPPPAPPKPGAFEPAGNVDPLQNIQSEIRRGDVLDGDAVESLIKDGWKTKPGN